MICFLLIVANEIIIITVIVNVLFGKLMILKDFLNACDVELLYNSSMIKCGFCFCEEILSYARTKG